MREIIYQALVSDAALNSLGYNESNIFPNYAFDGTSPRDTMFLIIRFGEQNIKAAQRGPVLVEIWVHRPEEMGADFDAIQKLGEEVRDCILPLVSETGGGYRITDVRFNGFGGDFKDIGYNTFTKRMGFEILSHPLG